MDRLQAETAQVVAQAVERKEDAPAIFDRVRALAAAAAGAAVPVPVAPGMAKGRKRPPRLTEAWFC
jgi:siroheme synthase